jgi:transposase
MSEGGGKTSRPWEPQRYRQQAHSPASKLPEGDLVFCRLDVVPQWDGRRCSALYAQERRGGPPLAPAMMVCLLL